MKFPIFIIILLSESVRTVVDLLKINACYGTASQSQSQDLLLEKVNSSVYDKSVRIGFYYGRVSESVSSVEECVKIR